MIAANSIISFPFACRCRCLVPVPGEDGRQESKDQTNRTSTPRNTCAIATRVHGVGRRPDCQTIGSAWPVAKLNTAAPVVPRTDIPLRPLAPVQPPMSPFSQLRREKPRKREATPKEIPNAAASHRRGGTSFAKRNRCLRFRGSRSAIAIAPAAIFKAPAELTQLRRAQLLRRRNEEWTSPRYLHRRLAYVRQLFFAKFSGHRAVLRVIDACF